MKKDRIKNLVIEQLRKIPIIQVACEKIGISRTTLYRWKSEDEEFRKKLEEALSEGEALVNDMGESQLLSLIKEKNWSAISFWLRHRNPKFRERVEITANFQSQQDELTPEQEAVVRQALSLSLLTVEKTEQKEINQQKIQKHEESQQPTNEKQQQNPTTGISGTNDQGS